MKKGKRMLFRKALCYGLIMTMLLADFSPAIVSTATSISGNTTQAEESTQVVKENTTAEETLSEDVFSKETTSEVVTSEEDFEEKSSVEDDSTANEKTTTKKESVKENTTESNSAEKDSEENGSTEEKTSEESTTEQKKDKQSFFIDEEAINSSQTGAEAEGNLEPLAETAVKEGYSDYSSYMTKHELKVNGAEIANGAVIDPSKSFALGLEFKLTLADMAKGGTKYYYKLPEHITIGNQGSETEPITLYNSARVPIGEYYIEDDVMYVSFPGYYDTVVAFFNMEASWEGTDNKAQISVAWPDKTETFSIDICDLTVAKTHSGYVTNEEGGFDVTFKVKVYPETEGATIDNITFLDSYRFDGLEMDENAYGPDKAICLTRYNADKSAIDSTYYKLSEVATDDDSFEITPISIENGGYFEVTYKATMPLENRMKIDATNDKDDFRNSATASYPYVDTTTGETHTLSAKASVTGTYTADSRWIFKKQGDDAKTKTIDNETKTIVPYVITINKHRTYSLGGSIVRDAIADFDDGSVVYETTSSKDIYVEIQDEDGIRKQQQKWIILDATVYEQLTDLANISSDTALERLRAEDTLESAILTAINTAQGTDYKEFSDEVALKYVFTDSNSNNFVWVMPNDEMPTTYTIHYNTIVDAAVGSFKNTASLWYTEYEGAPKGPGVGWTKPVNKVMNATKTNDGVYVGEDGNYYVDYKITVGVKEGSAGFEDIAVKEMFPYYLVDVGGQKIPVFDWLAGIDADSVDVANLTEEQNRALVDPLVKVSTKSTDSAVQQVVKNSFSGFHYECHGDSTPEKYAAGQQLDDAQSIEHTSSDPSDTNNYSYGKKPCRMAYEGEAVEAGQFLVSKDLEKLKKGETFSFGGIMIWLGDIPGTDKGYDIDIEFTLQVNPLLIEKMPEILEQTGKDYITNTNYAEVWTSFIYGGKETMNMRYGGFVQSMNSPYWIGVDKAVPGLTKNVVTSSSGVSNENNTVTYEIKVNPENSIDAKNVEYEIADVLGLTGVNYVDNSIVIYDNAGKVVYSKSGNPSVDASYKTHAGKISFEKTNYDKQSNSFNMKIDNTSGIFTAADGKLMPLTIRYDVDVRGIETDVDIVNDAALCKLETGPNGTGTVRTTLGEAHVEYAIDKALDKKIAEEPSKANDSTVEFYVDINPDSANAYQLKDIEAGESFTVKDELGKELLLILDTVKVFRYQGANYVSQEEITSTCKVAYVDDVMEIDIPVKNTGYKYRVYYNAMVMADASEYTAYDNEVSIEGTDIKKDKVQSKTWVYAYNQGSYATSNKIDLHKFDSYDASRGVQATFDLYRLKDGKWECITTEEYGHEPIKTDANGYFQIQNSTVNLTAVMLVEDNTWYKLVEIDTEDGYVLNPVPIYYYVSSAGERVSEDDVPRGIEEYELVKLKSNVSVNQDIPPVIYVPNQKFGFDVKKADTISKEVLQGAEFGLYSDEACTALVQKATSDEDGLASFRNIELADGKDTLYLKETKAPENYVLKDTVYTLKIEDGRIISAKDSEGATLSISNEGNLSLLNMFNDYESARILIQKTVISEDDSDEEKDFVFSARIYDDNGDLFDGKLDAIRKNQNGEETKIEYTNGSIFYLKHNESLEIIGLQDGYTYHVAEVYDQNFYTTVLVEDDVNAADDKRRQETTVATGTVESGNVDIISYTNKETDSLYLVKTAVDENGEPLELPDGLTFTISNKSLGKVAEVEWDSVQKKFLLSYKANQRISIDNSIANGFKIEGIKTEGISEKYTIMESNADIEGMAFSMYCTEYLPNGSNAYTSKGNFVVVDKNYKEFNDLKVEIENRYTRSYVETEIVAGKKYNKPIPKSTFEFGLYGKNYGDQALLQTSYADTDGMVSFEPIAYAKAGTYEYVIREMIPDGATYNYSTRTYTKDGIQYSEEKISVEVKVVTDDAGKLVVEYIHYNGEELAPSVLAEITNRYVAAGKWSPSVRKILNNGTLRASDFEFVLTEYTDNTYTTVKEELQKKTNEAPRYIKTTAEVLFDDVTYTYEDVGTHYYMVQEVVPADATNNQKDGVTYDTTQYKVEVVVEDNEDGTLKVTADYNNGDKEYIEVVNNYEASGSVTFDGIKRMMYSGLEEDAFTFELTEYTNGLWSKIKTDDAGNPIQYTFGNASATYDANSKYAEGEINYPTITFDENDVGMHYYILKEIVPSGAVGGSYGGVLYDTTKRRIQVEVTDNRDGTLSATVKSEDSLFDFVNYPDKTVEVRFDGNKTLTGRELEDKEFYYVADIYYTEQGSTTKNWLEDAKLIGKNDADGKIQFDKLKYNAEDVGRTYTYLIYEDEPYEGSVTYCPGVTYDRTSYTVNVEIGIDANNDLTANVTMQKRDGSAVSSLDYHNTYDAEGSVTFEATKLLKNKEIEDKEFEFGIYEGYTLIAKGTNDTNGKVTFEPIRFYIDGETTGVDSYIGEHTYTMKEIVPENPKPGYVYDGTEYKVVVNATDDGKGGIDVAVLEGASKNNAAGITYTIDVPSDKDASFVNEYEAKGTYTIEGTKVLNGRDMKDGEFTFTATEYKRNGDEEVATGRTFAGTNDSSGKVTFETITYEYTENVNDTGLYVYHITENALENTKSIVCDTREYTHECMVTHVGDGKLEVTGAVANEDIKFVNEYVPEGVLTFEVLKKAITPSGKDYKNSEHAFNVDIYEVSASKQENLLATLQVKAGEKAISDKMIYQLDDVGVHTYKIVERADVLPGYVNDTTVHMITVDVKNSGGEYLDVIVKDESGKVIATSKNGTVSCVVEFVNTYSAVGEVTFDGEKKIANVEKMVKEYQFAEGDFTFTVYELKDEETRTKVATGKSNAEGGVLFDTIHYTADDVGTHNYVICEDKKNKANNILSTAPEVKVSVLVTDKKDGTLGVEVTYENGEALALFLNKPTEVIIEKINKRGDLLKGAELQIFDENGDSVAEFTSNGEAKSVIGLDKNETYTLVETAPPKGYLTAQDITFTIDDDGVVYVIEEDETEEVTKIKMIDDDIPAKTGDVTNVLAIMVILLLALFGVFGFGKMKSRLK